MVSWRLFLLMLLILLSLFFSFFSTIVMGYLSMATPIGPWIAPTLFLMNSIIIRYTPYSKNKKYILLPVIAGSIGGILATASAFTFPAIYFINKELFHYLLGKPYCFIAIMFSLSFIAGLCAYFFSFYTKDKFINNSSLTFPIAQLVYGMVNSPNKENQTIQLMLGFCTSALSFISQSKILLTRSFIPSSFTLLKTKKCFFFTLPNIVIKSTMLPLLLAVGFVTGHVIAIPLFLGVIIRTLFLNPIHTYFYHHFSSTEMLLSFCAGIILFGSFIDCFSMIKRLIKSIIHKKVIIPNFTDLISLILKNKQACILLTIIFIITSFILYCLGISLSLALYTLIGSLICAYQLAFIAGKIGIAPLGRFATFVMLPALIFFSINPIEAVCIAMIVEVCGGVFVDIITGQVIATLANIDLKQVQKFQLLGLTASSLTIGCVFWLLINHFGLGSSELFVYKAQARYLLINAKQFDFYIMGLGTTFGLLFKYIRINAGLILGGLLMPIDLSLGLILGGLIAVLIKEKDKYVPFWSGIFAGSSIWIVIDSLLF